MNTRRIVGCVWDWISGVEKETLPIINPDEDISAFVKRRTIKPKGAVSERKFRRHCNCSDVGIPEKVLLLPPTQGNLIHS